jgi:hypothetical protein
LIVLSAAVFAGLSDTIAGDMMTKQEALCPSKGVVPKTIILDACNARPCGRRLGGNFNYTLDLTHIWR